MARIAQRIVPAGALIGLLVSLLVCGALVALAARAASADQLSLARQRWAAQAFRRYRLVVNEESSIGSCLQDVQVENERITSVGLSECGRLPSWTVTKLFRWAAGLDPYSSRCYPSTATCACHVVYTAQTRFDRQFGYPQQITQQWNLRINWAYVGHWERLLRLHELPDCGAVAYRLTDYMTVRVISLTRLP